MGESMTFSGSAIVCAVFFIVCLPDSGVCSCGSACRWCVNGICKGPCTPLARYRLYRNTCIPRCDGYCLKCLDYRQCSYCRKGWYVNAETNGDRICRAQGSACDTNCASPICFLYGYGKCDSECKIGYGLTSDHTCGECDENCLLAGTGCNVQGAGTCDVYCDANYYLDTDSYTCVECDVNCRPTIPGSCSVSGTCDTSCLSGYTLEISGVSQRCLACATSCVKCDTAGSGSCDTGSCVAGYVLDSSNQCSPCADNCDSCVTAGLCTTCSAGYGRTDMTAAESTCGVCASGCATCATNGAGLCDTCNAGYILTSDYICLQCQQPPQCSATTICTAAGTCASTDCGSGYTFDSNSNICA